MTARRPSSTAFWAAYLRYGVYDTSKVWSTIGGGIGKKYGPAENSCAARVSYGLNYGGAPISVFAAASMNYADHIYEGKAGDNMRYIVSAEQMKKYLNHAWGAPEYEPKSVAELDKILRDHDPNTCAIFATKGHTGALKAGYQDPYVTGYLPVQVWILSSRAPRPAGRRAVD